MESFIMYGKNKQSFYNNYSGFIITERLHIFRMKYFSLRFSALFSEFIYISAVQTRFVYYQQMCANHESR